MRLAALLVYGLGDVATTIGLMSLGGFESNPAVTVFLGWFGWPLGLLANEAVAIGLAWPLWRAVPSIGDSVSAHVGTSSRR